MHLVGTSKTLDSTQLRHQRIGRFYTWEIQPVPRHCPRPREAWTTGDTPPETYKATRGVGIPGLDTKSALLLAINAGLSERLSDPLLRSPLSPTSDIDWFLVGSYLVNLVSNTVTLYLDCATRPEGSGGAAGGERLKCGLPGDRASGGQSHTSVQMDSTSQSLKASASVLVRITFG